MKKSFLILALLVGFVAYPVSAQIPNITVNGNPSSQTGEPGGLSDVTIQLSADSVLSGNVTALNLLLMTPSTGPNSGVGFFTVFFQAGSASFPTSNSLSGPGNQSSFTTAGAGANAGFTISTPTLDLGANAGGGAGVAAPFTFQNIDTLRFAIDPLTPAGTYNFQATLGWPTELNGSFVGPAGNGGPDLGGTYHVTNGTTFSIVVGGVIPEPATWSLLGLGGLGSVGLTYLRARRRA